MTFPRIAPIEPPYTSEDEQRLERWMPADSEVEPLALFRTFARHPELMGRMLPLGAGILGHPTVAPRDREVMIHRRSARAGARYEWCVHASVFAEAVGLTEEQLISTARGAATDPCWAPREAAVFALADALHDHATIDDTLFAGLRGHFNEPQILELAITAGWYHAIAYVINVAGVPPEPWARAFPGS